MKAAEPEPQARTLAYWVLGTLLVLNAAVWLMQSPAVSMRDSLTLPVPQRIGDWQGRNWPLFHNEQAVLAPARLISRVYSPLKLHSQATRPNAELIWLNLLQSDSMSSMHNFYDSLLASGARPQVNDTRVIATAKGPLRATLIRCQKPDGAASYLLLWYQWPGGNAENRWRWYAEALRLKLSGRRPVWQLVEIATPVENPQTPILQSPELRRLEAFAKAFYQSAQREN